MKLLTCVIFTCFFAITSSQFKKPYDVNIPHWRANKNTLYWYSICNRDATVYWIDARNSIHKLNRNVVCGIVNVIILWSLEEWNRYFKFNIRYLPSYKRHLFKNYEMIEYLFVDSTMPHYSAFNDGFKNSANDMNRREEYLLNRYERGVRRMRRSLDNLEFIKGLFINRLKRLNIQVPSRDDEFIKVVEKNLNYPYTIKLYKKLLDRKIEEEIINHLKQEKVVYLNTSSIAPVHNKIKNLFDNFLISNRYNMSIIKQLIDVIDKKVAEKFKNKPMPRLPIWVILEQLNMKNTAIFYRYLTTIYHPPQQQRVKRNCNNGCNQCNNGGCNQCNGGCRQCNGGCRQCNNQYNNNNNQYYYYNNNELDRYECTLRPRFSHYENGIQVYNPLAHSIPTGVHITIQNNYCIFQVINQVYNHPGCIDFKSLMLHENGHAVGGIDDLIDKRYVMGGSNGWIINQDEYNFMNRMYAEFL